MGNNVSSDATTLVKEETFLLKVEQLSDTNNCSSSSDDDDDSSSCASYTEFHDSLQYLSSSPGGRGRSGRRHSLSKRQQRRMNGGDWNLEDCFRLPLNMFQRKQDPLRILNNDDLAADDYQEEIHGDTTDDNDNQKSSCWPRSLSQSATPRMPSSQRGSYKSSGSLSITSRNESKIDDSLNYESDNGYYSQSDRNENDDTSEDEGKEEYTCSPAAAYLYYRKSSSRLPATTTTTSAPTSSALQTSTQRFYHCYPVSGSSSSSFSKCKSAMSTTASSIPLFLDERNNSINNSWEYTQKELDMVDGDDPTAASNLQPPRRYWIVTTAALPWMTGTAVNPLLRAAYLSQRNRRLMKEEQRYAMETHRSEDSCGDNDEDDDDYDDASSIHSLSSISASCTVTLVLPWLEDPSDREKLYGPAWAAPDKTCDDQEAFIRRWLAKSAHLPLEAAPPSEGGIAIQWYPARYHSALSSIFALGDLCEMIPSTTTTSGTSEAITKKSDMICILEEPEHVNFYRAPGRESWRDRFGHVIGIVHTNYKAYARNHYSGLVTGPLVGALSSLMVRAYCDKVVKLSPVLQTYAPGKEVVSNVHGIRQEFFRVPILVASSASSSNVQCYFIGKLLWAKGLDRLLDLEAHFRKKTGKYFDIDIVGSGPEQSEIERSFLGKQQKQGLQERDATMSISASNEKTRMSHWRYFRQPVPARFLGRRDHAEVGPNYSIFVNPSVTEVLCTTTAEAVAMGKWVVIPRHASNEFFLQFPNCLQYKNRSEFVDLLQYVMSNPVKHVLEGRNTNNAQADGCLMDRSQLYAQLTWEAATERLIETAYLSKREASRRDRLTLQKEDKSIQDWHYTLGNGKSGDVLRKVLGGGPVAEQSTYKRDFGSALSTLSSAPSLVLSV